MNLDLNQYDAFIFDLDGTLINSEKYHTEGFAQAVESVCGYQITDEERREFFEGHTDTFVPKLAARHGLELDPLEVLKRKREYVNKHFRTEMFPQAIPFINKWRRRTRMALASNSTKPFVKKALVDIRMIDLFEVVCTAADVEHRKPDPEMYQMILKELNLSPAQVLVFEDSPAGVISAQRAGCPLVMVENGAGRSVEGVEKMTWKELMQF